MPILETNKTSWVAANHNLAGTGPRGGHQGQSCNSETRTWETTVGERERAIQSLRESESESASQRERLTALIHK